MSKKPGSIWLLAIVLLAAAPFVLTACGEEEEVPRTSITTTVARRSLQPEEHDGQRSFYTRVDTQGGESGESQRTVAVQLLTSTQYYLADKETEVSKQLAELVNSGTLNIFGVRTSYRSGYLVGAEVQYIAGERGLGNAVRVKPLLLGKFYWVEKDPEVHQQLLDSQSLHPFKIQTVTENGYLLAAEAWSYDAQALAQLSEAAKAQPEVAIKIVTSKQHYYVDKQPEVAAELTRLLDSGELDVVAVRTTYASGELVSAESNICRPARARQHCSSQALAVWQVLLERQGS